MDIKNYKKIHFIGIGGISMSGLAEIAAFSGISISGSDSDKNFDSSSLEKKGITVYKTHDKSNIKDDTELVVYTAAIIFRHYDEGFYISRFYSRNPRKNHNYINACGNFYGSWT